MINNIDIRQFPLWDKLKDKRLPLSFDLEVTARCNDDCRHCCINLPADDRESRQKKLSTKEILKIARKAASLEALWCLLTGGEPLRREDFVEIYLGLKRLGLLVSVFSNACLVTPRHVELFRKYPPPGWQPGCEQCGPIKVPREVLAAWGRLYQVHARRNLRLTGELLKDLALFESQSWRRVLPLRALS